MHQDTCLPACRVLPKWMVTVELLAKLNRTKPTLGIIPTGEYGKLELNAHVIAMM